MYSDARLGPQGAAWAKCRRKDTPPAASRSRFGVRTTGWPALPRQSPRHWSTVTNSTFRSGEGSGTGVNLMAGGREP